ncbi:uncharacterized protein L969DRAFT_93486 [Mixia osmundae IAM 14324]|uniref:AB hydrolase-1 domain-containing protein n=1 Tax=Mixia osmundae (strain CBS 9802 / IAM 14324 / JCM 22182 / KY 12970) TaxID=764103 RepID=G7DU41_MIXOS|nr:uncharacterized protein L969DRAFT_93486 [Mixia osmundae IAM 14324]KEI40968.1 hypothetical protein L969DRAFT_93486 [Mixia osmundae IAM 14324]GAA94101.1 hypothetical protein E5Q_00748 [Mixia osmundae IAM 14324]
MLSRTGLALARKTNVSRIASRNVSASISAVAQVDPRRSSGTNPALSFPCVDRNESVTESIRRQRTERVTPLIDNPEPASAPPDDQGPEPAYTNTVSGFKLFRYEHPFELDYGGLLPEFEIAYETWGNLNADKSNAVLIHTGLSASSHARSSPDNPATGWWEKFIGPGRPIDTNDHFVICTNVIGGCYGSTGPSSLDPSDGHPYATRFPILSIFDMVRAQFKLLDHLGIQKLFASVGSSMGGMQSIAAAHLEPERVGRVASISGTARSSPASIALRYAQRSVLMSDPNWNRGFYYDGLPPHTGMKLARQIATITYRSGPEWEQRFARRRRLVGNEVAAPALCPDFLIETYLDHQGEQFRQKYDANSLIYISKAMDLFDMSQDSLDELAASRNKLADLSKTQPEACAIEQTPRKKQSENVHISSLPSSLNPYLGSLTRGLKNLANTPTLILGVQSDVLFPIEQQRELAEALRMNGNRQVTYYESTAPTGHDTFLLDLPSVGGAIRGFLSM